MNLLARMLLLIVPHEAVLEVRCTTTEINHYYDGCGKLIFSQNIFWQGGDCIDWRFIEKSARPQYDHQTGQWVTRWVEGGRLIEVKSEFFRETWSQHDRELSEREFWPQERRRRILP